MCDCDCCDDYNYTPLYEQINAWLDLCRKNEREYEREQEIKRLNAPLEDMP